MIPMEAWGKDHWSTLAYIETVIVEYAGFEVGADARMRSNRRNFRVMREQCPRPRRPGRAALGVASSCGTILKGGAIVDGHDDWFCVQDMAHAGLFDRDADAIKPGVILHLSPQGLALAHRLRAHKAAGGRFADFNADA